MMQKILVFSLICFVLFSSGCIGEAGDAELVLGLQSNPGSTLALVALEEGFFEQQGLNVRFEEFTAGKFALQAFLAGSVDLAVVGDVPIVLATMQGNDFYVLTQTVEKTEENPILVLDEGLEHPREYFSRSRRKLTTSIGGTPEFYVYNFLKYYNIPESQVEIIAQKPEQMVAALTTGSVDAMSVFEPYPTMAEDLLPQKTRRYEIPAEIYSPLYVFVANKHWVDENPEKAEAILKALVQAEEFIENNPAEAKKIIAKRTKFSEELIIRIWDKFTVKAVITDGLTSLWEREARWAIETGKLEEMPIPDFENILRRDLLEKARSG